MQCRGKHIFSKNNLNGGTFFLNSAVSNFQNHGMRFKSDTSGQWHAQKFSAGGNINCQRESGNHRCRYRNKLLGNEFVPEQKRILPETFSSLTRFRQTKGFEKLVSLVIR